VATTLTDTSLGAVERALAEQRPPEAQRTSVMTHLVWAPKEWLPKAEAVLAGMAERHPSRTVILTPEPRRKDGLDALVDVVCFELEGSEQAVSSEVIELRLKGGRSKAPASIVMPLLIADLPVFCRWRGEPAWGSDELDQLLGVVDRLVVDSTEWKRLPRAFDQLTELFGRVAVSDIAWTRTRDWRVRLAELWPDIRLLGSVEVTGPYAEALLLAGWLRSRLRKHVDLVHRAGRTLRRVALDGEAVAPPPGDGLTPSDLLSEQLDVFGRDPVYEAAVAAASQS
jgi:glucose-6-phosphate dehydrogenase assembly protein OpcA